MPPPENLGRLLLEVKEGGGRDIHGSRSGFPRPQGCACSQVAGVQSRASWVQIIGRNKNEPNHHVTIQDMEPGDCDLDDEGVVKHLLVAAHRYAMDRMRLMCESMLCRRLDVENVAGIIVSS
jgi:speckle-type POZ protein